MHWHIVFVKNRQSPICWGIGAGAEQSRSSGARTTVGSELAGLWRDWNGVENSPRSRTERGAAQARGIEDEESGIVRCSVFSDSEPRGLRKPRTRSRAARAAAARYGGPHSGTHGRGEKRGTETRSAHRRSEGQVLSRRLGGVQRQG